MSKKQQIPNTQLSGRNIYSDKKKRVIYYDSLTKQGYLIEKKNEGRILFFQNRLVIILFIAILCAGTFLNWMQATLAGVALFAVVEIYYRAVFFKKLEVVTDVDFGRRLTPLQSIVARKSREKVLALIVLWAVFAVLVLVNAYMEQYSIGLMVFSVGLAIVGAYFCVLHIIALTRMKG
nr:hypothetical protein [uncultured Agathobaculum sp.]